MKVERLIYLFVTALCIPFCPTLSSAEIFQCGNTWQNKPCVDGTQRSAIKTTMTEPEDPLLAAKRRLTRQLYKPFIEMEESKSAKSKCLAETTSIDECENIVAKISATSAERSDAAERKAVEAAREEQLRFERMKAEARESHREFNAQLRHDEMMRELSAIRNGW